VRREYNLVNATTGSVPAHYVDVEQRLLALQAELRRLVRLPPDNSMRGPSKELALSTPKTIETIETIEIKRVHPVSRRTSRPNKPIPHSEEHQDQTSTFHIQKNIKTEEVNNLGVALRDSKLTG
jgi:hypothetical protein